MKGTGPAGPLVQCEQGRGDGGGLRVGRSGVNRGGLTMSLVQPLTTDLT